MKVLEYLENKWNSKYIYCYLVLLGIILCFVYNLFAKHAWLYAVLGLPFAAIVLYIAIDKRSYPKFKKGEQGIIVAIDIDDNNQYEKIMSKFVKPFKAQLRKLSTDYKVTMFSDFNIKNFNSKYNSKAQIRDFMRRHNYRFIIVGDSVFGSESESIECKLKFENVEYFQDGLSKEVRSYLTKIIISFLKSLSNIVIYKKTATDDYEVASQELELIFAAIISLIYLSSEQFEIAHVTLKKLNEDLKSFDNQNRVIATIKSFMNTFLSICCSQLAGNEIRAYYNDKDRSHFYLIKEYLNEAEGYEDSYDLKIRRSIYHFLKNRDVNTALKYLEGCEDEKNDPFWKINTVFLNLYRKDTIANFLNAYKTYKKVFDNEKIFYEEAIEIIEFIHMVLEEEPQKKQLHFILFLIYHYTGDVALADDHFKEFSDTYSCYFDSQTVKGMLLNLGRIKC